MTRMMLATLGRLGVYTAVISIAVVMILPFYWMVMTAFVPASDIIAFPPQWIPTRLTLEHFSEAFEKAPWLVYYRNSLIVAGVAVSCSTMFGLFAGYAFAIYRFPLQHVCFFLIIGTLMVPVQVTSVSLYIMLAQIRWVDTFLGILAPNFASAFAVFMVRQAIKAIPIDLVEAARMDGAGEIRIVLTIIAPLIKTTLATVAMILFLDSWNDFLWPVIVINSPNMRTLPVAIALFKDPYGNINYGPLMAATVLTIGPMVLAYAVSQKFMLRGIAFSGLKG